METEKKFNNVTYDAINIMRFICAILVIAIHTSPLSGKLGYLLSNVIARIAVPFFFISSGYFFYGKLKENDNYFKNYIWKIVKIYVIWYLVYFLWRIFFEFDKLSIKELLLIAREFLFTGYYQLWYLPSLIISILFVYMFMKKDKFKALYMICAALYSIGLLGDSYHGIINNRFLEIVLSYYKLIFGTSKTGICFGVPLITLGVVINKYNLNKKVKNIKTIIVISSTLFLVEAYLLELFNLGDGRNMYLMFLVLLPALFICLLNGKVKIKVNKSKILRDLSLEIYCSHALFIMIFDKTFNNLNSAEYYNFLKFTIVTIISIYFGLLIMKCKRKYIY